MRDLLLIVFALGRILAVSAAVDEHDLESSSDPGIGCAAMWNLTNVYFGWGDGYALPWVMTCIAWIESRWDPSAYNPSGATGLWQVEVPLWCNICDCSTLTTPDGAAQCANSVLQNQGLGAWTPDPTTCVDWLKYGGCPFSCPGEEIIRPRLPIEKLDAKTVRSLLPKA